VTEIETVRIRVWNHAFYCRGISEGGGGDRNPEAGAAPRGDMARLGILDLVALAATLAFALPIGLFGVQLLSNGRILLGIMGVVVAVGLVAVEQYVWTPADVPEDALSAVVRRLLP
jgi:hypothetical protein